MMVVLPLQQGQGQGQQGLVPVLVPVQELLL
jgi:hypothetical protein